MKPKIIIFFAICLSIGFLSGCELQREEYNMIFPENFYKNEADVKSAVTAAYHQYRIHTYGGGGIYSHGRGGINIYTEVTTDVMDCQWGDNGSWEMFHTHGWTANNSDNAANLYSKYKNVSQMRNIILQIEKSSVSDAVKQRYTGELNVLRAWLLYCLLDIYGPVPIAPDEALEDPSIEIYLERPTEEAYVSEIIAGLKYGIEVLPLRATEWGRVDGGSANMMLLKVYMHQKRWSEAATVARELMDTKYGYKLLDNYYDCFSIATEVNDENIWVITCNNENYVNGWITHTITGDCPYPNTAIERWAGYRMPWDFYRTFEANDKRLENIIGEYISTVDGSVVNEQNPGGEIIKGALPLKYTVDMNQRGDRSGIDVPIFRFSDVLLSLSECIARQNGVNQECMDLVNRVRNRVGLTDLALADYTDINKFYDMILLERGHELYCEGHRRTDLIRFGKYIEFNKKVNNSQTADHKVLFPIPNTYLVESKGAVKQNSGY